jgi:hypothetical protein
VANAAAAALTMGSRMECSERTEWTRCRKSGFVVREEGVGGIVGVLPRVRERVLAVGGVERRERR